MNDILNAVQDYLLLDEGIADLVVDRVYAGELGEAENNQQPRKAIVVRLEGGDDKIGRAPISRQTIVIYAYADNYYEAGKVDRAVFDALDKLKRKTIGSVFLHCALMSSGSDMTKDNDTGWVAVIRNGTLIADDGTA